ncbi:MAG TPA: NAD(P)H-hydrate dehydratase [Gammaproteobacteria bacterium]|nr:NAD(P)H-hydrate dehydratase [Gammaproteobacteria bacterium]
MNVLPALATLQQLLPARTWDAHKGDFGTLLIVGGGVGMSGAALMTGMAAQRGGAGKVMIATDVSHAASITQNWPSLMAYGVSDAYSLQPLLDRATHIAIGPGLGQSSWAQGLFHTVLNTHLSLILDADALNLLAAQPQKRKDWVLTPHLGEAARLLGCSPIEIKNDREQAIQALQKKYGGCIVLKGAHTLIHDETGLWTCHAGNPGMATAGMGDLLTGVIAALMAQGLSPLASAQLGGSVHAQAGDEAAKQGPRGMIPTDLLPFIRQFVNP